MEYVCRCGFKTNDINSLIRHVFTECGLENIDMNNEVERYKYYSRLVKFAFEDLLKRIADGTFDIKGCHIDEFRAFWILLSTGMIEDNLFGATPEMAQLLILEYAPDIAIATLEYAGIVEVAVENGKLVVKKR